MLEIIAWTLVVICFALAFIGLVYPVIPGVLFLVAGFFAYGFCLSFSDFSWLFWLIQSMFLLLILISDQLINVLGVKKLGGSKAGVWGSTIGLLIGPFVFPVAGILLGPFVGAIVGEFIFNRTELKKSILLGVGSVASFIGSVAMKAIIQLIMIGYFLFRVLK